MYLGNLSISIPTSVTKCIVGNFVNINNIHIIFAKLSILELYSIENDSELTLLIRQDTFGNIVNVNKLWRKSENKDLILLLTDSGILSIITPDLSTKRYNIKFQYTYGKSGIRRGIPCEYVCSHNEGDIIVIGGIEKKKMVFICNQINEQYNEDKKDDSIISYAPIEINSNFSICFDIKIVEMGYEDPIICSIEMAYKDELDEKQLNLPSKCMQIYKIETHTHIIIKYNSVKIDDDSHMIIPVYKRKSKENKKIRKGFIVIICGEKNISFYNLKKSKIIYKKPISNIIVSYTYTEDYNIICQYNDGRFIIIKITDDNNKFNFDINYIYNKYGYNVFKDINLLNDNLLLCTSDINSSYLYSYDIENNNFSNSKCVINSLSPLIDFQLVNRNQNYIIYFICGMGEEAWLKEWKMKECWKFVDFQEVKICDDFNTNISPPPIPTNIFTLRKEYDDKYDSYIVVSYSNRTKFYELNNDNEFHISKGMEKILSVNGETLTISNIYNQKCHSTYLQITKNTIIYTKNKVKKEINPSNDIKNASNNNRQIIASLKGGEICYIEIDDDELVQPETKKLKEEIDLIELGSEDEYTSKSKYAIIVSNENLIKFISLEFEKLFHCLKAMKFPNKICNVKMIGNEDEINDSATFYISLITGHLIILKITYKINGDFDTEISSKFIDNSDILKLSKINNNIYIFNKHNIICENNGKYMKIVYENEKNNEFLVNNIIKFNDKKYDNILLVQLEDKLIFVRTDNKIENPKNLYRLKYNPKKMYVTFNGYIILLECSKHKIINKSNDTENTIINISQSNNNQKLNDKDNNNIYQSHSVTYSSLVELLSPSLSVFFSYEFPKNEAIISHYLSNNIVTDMSNNNIQYLYISTAYDYEEFEGYEESYLYIFEIKKDKEGVDKCEMKIKLQTPGLTLSFCDYNLDILCSIFDYDTDITKLYYISDFELKYANTKFDFEINSLIIKGDRILCSSNNGDINLFILKYSKEGDNFIITHDDFYSRKVKFSKFLDFDTIVGADKFANFFVYQIEEEEKNIACNKNEIYKSVRIINHDTDKFNLLFEFNVGDIIVNLYPITIMDKVSISNQKKAEEQNLELNEEEKKENIDNISLKFLLYSTFSGKFGILFQFNSKRDSIFFQKLYYFLREDIDNLSGRDILKCKGMYIPMKGIIDMDLIKEFFWLKEENKKSICNNLGVKLETIEKKIKHYINILE